MDSILSLTVSLRLLSASSGSPIADGEKLLPVVWKWKGHDCVFSLKETGPLLPQAPEQVIPLDIDDDKVTESLAKLTIDPKFLLDLSQVTLRKELGAGSYGTSPRSPQLLATSCESLLW